MIEEWAIGVWIVELEGKKEIVRKAASDLPKGDIAGVEEQRRRLEAIRAEPKKAAAETQPEES